MDLEKIKSLVIAHVDSFSDLNVDDLQAIGPLHRRPYGEIYRVNNKKNRMPLAIKICKYPHKGLPNFKFAKRQYDDLVRAYQLLNGNERFGSPAPLALIPDDAIVIMEWIDGPSAADMILGDRLEKPELLSLIKDMALWLRYFHDKNQIAHENPNTSTLLEELNEIKKKTGIKSASVEKALKTMGLSSDIIAGMSLEVCGVHGDYQPSNVLFKDNKVYGIDITYAKRDFCINDVCILLNSIARFMFLPKGLRLMKYWKDIMTIFVDSYAQGKTSHFAISLSWFRLYHLVKYYLHHYTSDKNILKREYFHLTQKLLISLEIKKLRQLND